MQTRDKDDLRLSKMEKASKSYGAKYAKHMELLEDSVLAKVKGGIGFYEIYALGKQLEQFEQYQEFCEDQGNVNLLGQIPNIAFDVITAVHGASIIPIIASVQPIDEERGTVYFKQVRDATTRGSATAGGVVVDPRTGVVTPQGYANSSFSNVAVAATVAATFTYTFVLAGPIKSESLSIKLGSNANVKGKDVGQAFMSPTTPGVGQIFGAGLSGTVTYATGSVTITFTADPGTFAGNIIVSYQQNYELSTDLPQIDTFFDSQGILAKVYALKGTMGMLQSYGMSKRFGLAAEDELSKDLVQEINREIGGDLIRGLSAAVVNTVTFSKTPPAGVSYFEHKQTYFDKLADAEANLILQSGRGTISLLIVGKAHAAVIQTLPGFVKLFDGAALGAHVFGTLNGITVIRVTESSMLADNNGLAIWKGLSPFEAAAVYSPFMPLTVTGTLPQAPNPLQSMRAAAVWAGVDVLVPQFVTGINISA